MGRLLPVNENEHCQWRLVFPKCTWAPPGCPRFDGQIDTIGHHQLDSKMFGGGGGRLVFPGALGPNQVVHGLMDRSTQLGIISGIPRGRCVWAHPRLNVTTWTQLVHHWSKLFDFGPIPPANRGFGSFLPTHGGLTWNSDFVPFPYRISDLASLNSYAKLTRSHNSDLAF